MDINSSTYFFMYDSCSQTYLSPGIFQNVVPFTVPSILPRFQFIKLKPFFFDLNQILYFSGNEWWFLEFNFWRTKSSLMTVLFMRTPCTVLTVKYIWLWSNLLNQNIQNVKTPKGILGSFVQRYSFKFRALKGWDFRDDCTELNHICFLTFMIPCNCKLVYVFA